MAALFSVTVEGANTATAEESPKTRGNLVIIGGGKYQMGYMKELSRWLAAGEKARIIVIGLASENPIEAAANSVKEFGSCGFTNLTTLPDTGANGSHAVDAASGVYFTGGDQVKLAAALRDTPVIQALQRLRQRGGVIAGTSAGAAVMSEHMITGEERGNPTDMFRSIQRDQVMTTNGLGFLPQAIIDQHFFARKRANRLFSMVLEKPKLLGVGIDESTAIVVGPDEKFEVIGDRNVMVIDARKAGAVQTGPDRNLSANDLRVHILTAGDRFDIKSGKATLAKKTSASR